LTVHQAAAERDVLICVVVVVLAGAIVLFPALVLLFRLTATGRFRADVSAASEGKLDARPSRSTGALLRPAGACLIAGIGLLNIASAGWAHAIGVAALIGFVVLAFLAIAAPGLDEQTVTGLGRRSPTTEV
jgi:cytochrome d ubiquinol oxidase subunit II